MEETKKRKKRKAKKIVTLKEALQIKLNQVVTVVTKSGKKKKVRLIEVLSEKIVIDAIKNDGATRRLLLRDDILNLQVKEQEYVEIEEIDEEEQIRLRNILVDIMNDSTRK